METRLKQLDQLHSFVEGVDKDLTMMLKSLQWNKKHLLSDVPMVTCRYNNNHKLPLNKMESHEPNCFMKLQGYTEDDELLPEPLDMNANTLVKFSTQQVITILNDASRCNTMFKRGNNRESRCSEPCSLARLQATYTADERRALHDAVVQAVPSCHDLADLALSTCCSDEGAGRVKSRVEILGELRDMRRRRTKYRQAAKTRNYSDVLRDVIKTQMESYSGTTQFSKQTKNNSAISDNTCTQNNSKLSSTRDRDFGTYFHNQDAREQPSKYFKSPARDTNRYASSSSNNSKRTLSGNYAREGQQSDHLYRNRDRDNYNRNDSKIGKPYQNESRDKNTSSSHRRYEHEQYRTNDRSVRNINETQQRRNNYSRKRNRDTYSSDETEDSRSTDREYRRRDRQSSNYDTFRSKVERTHNKAERSECPERPRSGKSRKTLAHTHNRNPEFHTDIKQERISPDMNEKRGHGNTSRSIDDANSGPSTLIKVEKTESRYSYSRSESDTSDYTEDKRGDSITKKESVSNTDKRIEDRQEESSFESTSRYRQSRHSERHTDNTNSNRESVVPIKEESGETNTKMNRQREKMRSHKHGHHRRRSSSATSDIAERKHDRRRKIYDRREENTSSSSINKEAGSNTFNKSNNCHKDDTRYDVRATETSYDERGKRKKYS